MTTIREFVESNLLIPKSPLNISRALMPQITKNGYDKFVDFLKKEGVPYEEKKVPMLSLKPSQNEFDLDKIRARIGKDSTKDRPVIISQDNYILDGHHRWIAEVNGMQSTKQDKIDVLQVKVPIIELLNIARSYEGVHFRDVDDNPQSISKIKSIIFGKDK